jgi:hypothetical protein
MVNMWEQWKKGFDAWENSTAKLLEQWLASPLVLEPSGAMLGAVAKMKTATDKAAALWWGTLGLPTKHDQERSLHALNMLNSKLIDLEERLADMEARAQAPAAAAAPVAEPAESAPAEGERPSRRRAAKE